MKFSIVTPAYNMEQWISHTIESVLSQAGDFEIEYIIVDGGSSDKTLAIAESYAIEISEKRYPTHCNVVTMRVIPQEQSGMYMAINEGFTIATGDVYAWINADDTYQPGAFAAIAATLSAFPDIEWIKGITDTIDSEWHTVRTGACRIYRRDWLEQGIYGRESYFIEQDSCFWRADLWKKAGPIPVHYRRAGDYWLWLSFAQIAPLWSLDVPISNFMKREGQLSRDIEKYAAEQGKARPRRTFTAWSARFFFAPWSRLGPAFHPIFLKLYPLLFMQTPFEYIHIEGAQITKRIAQSFIV